MYFPQKLSLNANWKTFLSFYKKRNTVKESLYKTVITFNQIVTTKQALKNIVIKRNKFSKMVDNLDKNFYRKQHQNA